jgi:hypothetical protein
MTLAPDGEECPRRLMLIIRRKINNAWLQEHAPIILLLIAISLLFTPSNFSIPSIPSILALTFIAHQLGLSLIRRIQGCKQGLLFDQLRGTILKFARTRINPGVGENG